jgi:hypothetical protein
MIFTELGAFHFLLLFVRAGVGDPGSRALRVEGPVSYIHRPFLCIAEFAS